MITVGVIGLGRIVQQHIEAMGRLGRFRVTGVCDVDADKASSWAGQLDCRSHTEIGGLLSDAPDVVVICLPHSLHAQAAVAALAAGCHVVVEKPMATSVSDCRRMLTAAEDSGLALIVADLSLGDAGAACTGARFEQGGLGRFLAGSMLNGRRYFTPDRPVWFLNPEMSGGGMFSNVGMHRLALTRQALRGLRPISVRASVRHVPEHRVEACVSAIVNYEDGGAMLYEELGYFPWAEWLNYGSHFAFEAGVVAWRDDTWRMMRRDGRTVEERMPPPLPAYEHCYRQLLDAMDGQTVAPSARDMAEDVAIAQACYASSRETREVSLSDPAWSVQPLARNAAQAAECCRPA